MSAPSAAPNTASAAASSVPASANAAGAAPQEILPAATTLLHAARLAIQQDKPIQLDYYQETATGKAFMGEDADTKEKMLVKSAEEFTSLIQKVYKVGEDFIVMTENSIYVASGKIQKRRIQAAQLRSQGEDA
jgi:3-oxoacyl-ACP reductase-like protein